MPAKKHRVVLEQSQVSYLTELTRKGKRSAREITRARVLLMTNEHGPSKTDKETASFLGLSKRTVQAIRARYATLGIEAAIHDQPRPGRPRVLTKSQEATIIATACTNPPDGCDHWTLDLLTEKIIGRNDPGSRSTVYRVCLKHDLKP